MSLSVVKANTIQLAEAQVASNIVPVKSLLPSIINYAETFVFYKNSTDILGKETKLELTDKEKNERRVARNYYIKHALANVRDILMHPVEGQRCHLIGSTSSAKQNSIDTVVISSYKEATEFYRNTVGKFVNLPTDIDPILIFNPLLKEASKYNLGSNVLFIGKSFFSLSNDDQVKILIGEVAKLYQKKEFLVTSTPNSFILMLKKLTLIGNDQTTKGSILSSEKSLLLIKDGTKKFNIDGRMTNTGILNSFFTELIQAEYLISKGYQKVVEPLLTTLPEEVKNSKIRFLFDRIYKKVFGTPPYFLYGMTLDDENIPAHPVAYSKLNDPKLIITHCYKRLTSFVDPTKGNEIILNILTPLYKLCEETRAELTSPSQYAKNNLDRMEIIRGLAEDIIYGKSNILSSFKQAFGPGSLLLFKGNWSKHKCSEGNLELKEKDLQLLLLDHFQSYKALRPLILKMLSVLTGEQRVTDPSFTLEKP